MEFRFYKAAFSIRKKVAVGLLFVMTIELLLPLRAVALTSGPSQPEFQGFSPLATTSLVDPFSGDFSYNIPLMDIEGYPLNLVYRPTSNTEEEGSWVGYGWNVNVGTLNRHVRGLPDDMNGGEIKSYQNIRNRTLHSIGVSVEPSFNISAAIANIGASAGVNANFGVTFDDDNYIGNSVGLAIGGGVYAGINAGPFSLGGSAGVTLAAHSSAGGTISTYAGFNAGMAMNDYVSIGFGKSVNRSFNTISGWEHPNVIGSFNISNITREVQRNFVGSINNQIPQFTNSYRYNTDGVGFRLGLNFSMGIMEDVGIDLGVGVAVTQSRSMTTYNDKSIHKGYGYMYSEKARAADLLDFTRDNDGGLNKDLPFLPPAMKTFDIFSSTAHNATPVFRADRNDFGTVRDPSIRFQNLEQKNERHEVDIKLYFTWTCIGVGINYHNVKTSTEGHVAAGGCADDAIAYRETKGKDLNLFFKPTGSNTLTDDSYLNQVKKYQHYGYNIADSVRGVTPQKRMLTSDPVAVFTNKNIKDLPQTVVPKKIEDYAMNVFPYNPDSIRYLDRPDSSEVEESKIGAILNTNKSGQTYVYATPVNNNIKNEVAFRVNGFAENALESEGIIEFPIANDSPGHKNYRDYLYKNTLTPGYATSYLLNAVLSPDYLDVKNDGVTDDDLGGFVKFNYSKAEEDYRWRAPYADAEERKALINRAAKVTKFDDMASYVIGSKEVWYAHSIESKNLVAEFYLSDRQDAKDSRSKVLDGSHPYSVSEYSNNKSEHARLRKLDCIKLYSKHDRYVNKTAAVPLKTIYFEYDYSISSNVPNSENGGGKLKLLKVKVQHGNEPIELAETYDFGYTGFNPSYNIGDKDGWGNYYPNERSLPLHEFPYINQRNRQQKDEIASAFHMNRIALPSGGKIEVDYEADDYSFVQNKRSMALLEVAGVGPSSNVVKTDVGGLYDYSSRPYLYIYVKNDDQMLSSNKSALLNNTDLMYFSFNIKIAGSNFDDYDQVKGYASVETTGVCPNDPNYIYIKVRPVNLTGTSVKPSPMTNAAINMARAFASDQLYFQEKERATKGLNQNQGARLSKAANQVADALMGKNSIAELMKDYQAGKHYRKDRSFVRLAINLPKIGGGSRVAQLTFDDEWNSMIGSESSSLIGYRYHYVDKDGLSSGVASYEPLVGGEENPCRSGSSYTLSSNPSKYPPYDPVEMLKEDPVGESFYPTGSVGYSRVVIESIHKAYARSAQSKLVHEYYTAKDFPYVSSFGAMSVKEVKDEDYPNPGARDILLSFLGVSSTLSASENSYEMSQNFLIETNDMHGKPKGTYNYRLLLKNGKEELVNSTEYYYHTNGYNGLSNEVDVLQYKGYKPTPCKVWDDYPLANIVPEKKTLGVDIDVCSDSREVVTTEKRKLAKRGGGFKICALPPSFKPNFAWVDNEHHHVDYFKATTTTKVVNRYGILKSVRNYKEGAETIVENKYYDGVTGEAVVQMVRDKFGDSVYNTQVPAYWTKTDLEPSFLDYPFFGEHPQTKVLPDTLVFGTTGIGYLSGSNLITAKFTTPHDLFHPGDQLFVKGGSNKISGINWHRLYVTDVFVKKHNFGEPDPLALRFGSSVTSGATYEVVVSPYKVNNLSSNEIGNGDMIYWISSVFKYRPGRKNMLDLVAGSYQSYKDPYKYQDSVANGKIGDIDSCNSPSFMKPVINASASRYLSTHSVPGGNLNNLTFNPVSIGLLNQPYVGITYALLGTRQDPSGAMRQRQHGLLPNWYYWLPARYDSSGSNAILSPMLKNYNSYIYNSYALVAPNAVWDTLTQITTSIPGIGPVEDTNAIGIYSSIYVEPRTKKVMHVTANGRFGQTWVETFEDMKYLRKPNSITDFIFSPFQKYMTSSTGVAPGYHVFDNSQVLSQPDLTGSFALNQDHAHTGIYSLFASANTTLKLTPKKHTGNLGYYYNDYVFNLDGGSDQPYTCEVWVKKTSGSITAPSITVGGSAVNMSSVVQNVDGWSLYRAQIKVSDNVAVTFTFPAGQYYDDLRVFASKSTVKAYVYHPYKNYLMAVLDENNTATFYEYNTRNQLVRLKKETEKGVITITENIKNIVSK